MGLVRMHSISRPPAWGALALAVTLLFGLAGAATAQTQPKAEPLNRSASSRRSTAKISSRWRHPTLSGAKMPLPRRAACPPPRDWLMSRFLAVVAATPPLAPSLQV